MGLINISEEQYQNLAFSWGLHYDLENKVIYGARKGYPFLLTVSQNSAPLMFTIMTSATSSLCPKIGKAEQKLLKDKASPILMVRQRDSKIIVQCGNILDFNGAKKAVDSILSAVVSFLKEKDFVPCCENCKHPEQTNVLLTGYEYRHLCPQCEEQIAAQSSKTLSSDKAARKNSMRGIVSAVAGALIGIILMAFMFRYVNGVIAFILMGIFLGATTVYMGMNVGNRPSTAVIVTVAVILILAVFAGYNIGYVALWATEYKRKLSVYVAINAHLIALLHGGVYVNVWMKHLAVTYLGAVIGGIAAYRSASKGFGRYCKVAHIGREKNEIGRASCRERVY